MPRVAVVVFPGTNSEDETVRAARGRGVGAEARALEPRRGRRCARSTLTCCRAASRTKIACAPARSPRTIDADGRGHRGRASRQVRDRHLQRRADAARSGLVPGTGPLRRPTAAFAPNAPADVSCRARLRAARRAAGARRRCWPGCRTARSIPAWAVARRRPARRTPERARTARTRRPPRVRVLRRARRARPAAPNGSALGAAGLIEPRRQRARDHAASRARRVDVHAPRRRPGPRRDGGRASDARAVGRNHAFSKLCRELAWRWRRAVIERAFAIRLTIPDNEAYTALATLRAAGRARREGSAPTSGYSCSDRRCGGRAGVEAAARDDRDDLQPEQASARARADAASAPGEVWIIARDETPAAHDRVTIGGVELPGVRRIVRRDLLAAPRRVRGTTFRNRSCDRAIETLSVQSRVSTRQLQS